MKFTKFKTEYSFDKWFRKNWEKFEFTSLNLRGVDEPVEIARLTDKNRTVGLVTYNQWEKDEIYIALFEVQEKYRGRGYARKMLDMLLEETKAKFVLLDYCYDDDESRKFWKHMGFRRRIKHAVDETEMYKRIKKNKGE